MTITTVETHLNWLGHEVVDAVTGFVGVVTSMSFDLSGCVQAFVKPKIDKDGKMPDGHWFDIARLDLKDASAAAVMRVPRNAQFSLSAAETSGPEQLAPKN